VVAQLVGELRVQRPAVGVQPLEVTRSELDGEVIRHQPPVPGQDPRGVVDLTLERRRQLDRLDVALESTREDTAHNAFQASLEALQRSHASSSTVGTPGTGRPPVVADTHRVRRSIVSGGSTEPAM
jgi:hypothetical protein